MWAVHVEKVSFAVEQLIFTVLLPPTCELVRSYPFLPNNSSRRRGTGWVSIVYVTPTDASLALLSKSLGEQTNTNDTASPYVSNHLLITGK